MSGSDIMLSIVTPVYNEEEVCDVFFDRLLPILASITADFEVVCVDDGSRDGTLETLMRRRRDEPRIKVLSLSRNFGKDPALMAGIDYARGAAVVPIDADLQDPPELIADMVAKWREGYDTVIGVRSDRSQESRPKRWSASMFYRVMGQVSAVDVPPNAGDFRLLDRKLVDALRRLPERSRFMKGLYAWVGTNPTFLYYERPERVAGKTKWRYWRLWNFALDGIFSFTTLPLRIWTYVGVFVSGMSGLLGLYIVLTTLMRGADMPGSTTVLLAVLFLSGVNMIGLGVLGEYIGRIFHEVKQRPLYLVDRAIGFEQLPEANGRPILPGSPRLLE
ncbi:MAG: glycosyltransferase family 2 protein [Pseudomonadota bacterium]